MILIVNGVMVADVMMILAVMIADVMMNAAVIGREIVMKVKKDLLRRDGDHNPGK